MRDIEAKLDKLIAYNDLLIRTLLDIAYVQSPGHGGPNNLWYLKERVDKELENLQNPEKPNE